MMLFSHILIVGLGIDCLTNAPIGSTDKNYVCLTLAGQTCLYASSATGLITERGTTRLWYVRMGESSDRFLSIAVCGDRWGTFPFGQEQSVQPGISLVTVGMTNTVYSSYVAVSAHDDQAARTWGEVRLDAENDSGPINGVFSGVLMPRADELHNRPRLPISGHFHLRR